MVDGSNTDSLVDRKNSDPLGSESIQYSIQDRCVLYNNQTLPHSYASDTHSINLYQLVQETCMKYLTQVHHSFLHQNNSLANHVTQFLSCAGQFLCWNLYSSTETVLNCVQETCTRKNGKPVNGGPKFSYHVYP